MKRLIAATCMIALCAGCLSTKPNQPVGKSSPKLKDEAIKAEQLPLVLPNTITEQNHKQKLQMFAEELSTDRESGGRAYVEATPK